MAKWGEGDPRWIVEERPDATNVNNWHWTEKNASQWSKDLLTSLLKGLEIEESGRGKCTIHEIDKIDGEAVANNRKAKLIFFYEWTIDLKWKGSVEGSSKVIEGSIHIPNLSEENSPEEIDIDVSVSSSSDNGDKLKQMLRTTGAKIIRQQLAKYIKSLREDFTQGMILPSKTQEEQRKNNINNGKDKSRLAENASSANRDMQRLNLGSRIETKTLTASEIFKCPAVELYNALTLPELVQAFTNGSVSLEATKGGKFSLFGGNVTGEFTELVPNQKICQKWRYGTWPDGHFSNVELTLDDKGDSTQLTLKQTGIPASDFERTEEGWRNYYWTGIKRTFGFGSFLY